MALKKSEITSQGFNAVDAYHRIENINLITKNSIRFVVRSYKDNATLATFKERLYSCDYDLYGNNPVATAYLYIKSLPEFIGYVDC